MAISMSKTELKKRQRRKTNPQLAAAVYWATKNPAWIKFAKLLSQSTKLQSAINLKEIDEKTKLGDLVLIPGRVLSVGEITKKIRICSFGISNQAKEKLTKTHSEWINILDEIKRNPKAEGFKIIK